MPPDMSTATLEADAPVQVKVLRRRQTTLTDRTNVEPAILQGMTVTEAKFIGIVAMLAWLLLAALIFVVTGIWQVFLLLGVFGPAATLWLASSYLAHIKRGKPDGYYSQALALRMVAWGLGKPVLKDREGWWSQGREFPLAPYDEKPVSSRKAASP